MIENILNIGTRERIIEILNKTKSRKLLVPRVGVSSQTASSVHSRFTFLKKDREEKQPSKSAAGPLLTALEARRGIAPICPERYREGKMISSPAYVFFFFLPTPPSDLSAALITCPSYAMRTTRNNRLSR